MKRYKLCRCGHQKKLHRIDGCIVSLCNCQSYKRIKRKVTEMNRKVYFYRDRTNEEIITLCKRCAKQYGNDIKEIDLAGEWDMCSNCEAQNIPASYNQVAVQGQ